MTKHQAQQKADKLLAVSRWFRLARRPVESTRYRDAAHALLRRYGLPYAQTARDIKRRKDIVR